MRRALGLALMLPLASLAALPDTVLQAAVEWRALGRGEARWLGIRLYEASLWVGGERLEFDQPFALSIRYARDIRRQRLVESSIAEMRRLGAGTPAQIEAWERRLGLIFPDVGAGETIVGLYLPGRGASFFHQGRAVGAIEDPQFAQGFFAIWLDPRTRDPELRAQLLGAP